MNVRRTLRLVLLALVASVPAPARGDVVHLKSGSQITGLATEEGDRLRVRSFRGATTLSLENVVHVDRDHEDPFETWLTLEREAEAANAPEAWLAAASVAAEHGGGRQARRAVERAARSLPEKIDANELEALIVPHWERLGETLAPLWRRLLLLDGEHEAARRALGYRRLDGAWVTEEELQIAQGNVKFEGEWMPSIERDRIMHQRALKLDEREEAIARADRRLAEREAELERLTRRLIAAEERIEAWKRDLEAQRAQLLRREREVERQSTILRSIHFCRSCRGWYSGRHLCSGRLHHCGVCGGYFRGGHRH